MIDLIVTILWLVTTGNWIIALVAFYFAYNGMYDMSIMGSSGLGILSFFQGVGFGLIFVVIGTISGAIAILISDIRKIRLELQKEGD